MTGVKAQPVPDGHNAGASSGAAERLPQWDLSDLYDGIDSPVLQRDLEDAKVQAAGFRQRYAGRMATESASGIAEALKRYEAIEEVLGRIMSYAQLLFSGDSSDAPTARFYQSMSERVTEITTDLLFFSLELNRLDEADLAPKVAEPVLAPWASWLSDLRVFKPHQLSDEIETLLHEKDVTGASAWSRLFDETMAGLRVAVGEERWTSSAALYPETQRLIHGPVPSGIRDATHSYPEHSLPSSVTRLALIESTPTAAACTQPILPLLQFRKDERRRTRSGSELKNSSDAREPVYSHPDQDGRRLPAWHAEFPDFS